MKAPIISFIRKVFISTLFIILSSLLMTVEGKEKTVVIDTLLDTAIEQSYKTHFGKLKKKYKATGSVTGLFFPDTTLMGYSNWIIEGFVEEYSESLDKKKKVEVSFDEYASDFYIEITKKRGKKDIENGDKENFSLAKEKIKKPFLEITGYSFYQYLRLLTIKSIESDKAVTVALQQQKKEEENLYQRMNALQDSIKEVREAEQRRQEEYIKLLQDSIAKEKQNAQKRLDVKLKGQKKELSSAITVEEKRNKDIENILKAKSDYSLDEITADVERKIYEQLNRLYIKSKDMFRFKDDYALDNKQHKSIEAKLDTLGNTLEFYNLIENINGILDNTISKIRESNRGLYNVSTLEYYHLTSEQKKDLQQLKINLYKYNKCKQAFNALLVTLDGKDVKGKSSELHQYAEGRLKEEKIKKQKALIDSYKKENPEWPNFPAIKKGVEHIEKNNANESFARFTL